MSVRRLRRDLNRRVSGAGYYRHVGDMEVTGALLGPTISNLVTAVATLTATTTTPVQLAFTSVTGMFKAIVLRWLVQYNLRTFDHYELQVSADETDWYSLQFDGTDWKGTLNAWTEGYAPMMVHVPIPFGGTAEEPTAVELYYRVRQATKGGDKSDWSDHASATTLLVDNGDIAANTITGNKIVAGEIDTYHLAAYAVETGNIALYNITPELLSSADVDQFFDNVGNAPSNEYLIAHYPFNDSLVDTSWNGHDGVLTGSETYDGGVAGNGFDFQGLAGQYITTDVDLDGLTEFSISLWMKADTWLASHRVAVSNYKYNTGGTTVTGFYLGQAWANENDIQFAVFKSGVAGALAGTSDNSFTTDVLRHVVAVFKGGEYVRLYVDGVLVAEDTSSVPVDITAEYDVFLGRRTDSTSYPWDGLIEEVRIYNKALDMGNVSWLYRNPAGTPVDTAVQLETITALANEAQQTAEDAQTTADGKITTWFQDEAPALSDPNDIGDLWYDTDGTPKRLYRWNGATWDGVDEYSDDAYQAAVDAQDTADGKIVTYFQDEAPTAEGVGDLWFDTDDDMRLYRWSATAWVEVPVVDIAPSDEYLVGYWPLNDSPDDFSGNGYHGVLTAGSSGYEAGVVGKAFHFDGVSSNIVLPASLGTFTAITIAAWINADTLSPAETYNRVFELRESASGDIIQLYLHSSGDDKIYFNIYEGAVSYSAIGNVAISAATPTFVVGTYDGTTVRLYINGILQSTTATVAAVSFTPNQGTIGGRADAPQSNNWDGLLDEVRIYNKALSQAEVSFLYRNPAGVQPALVLPKDPGTEYLEAYYTLNSSFNDYSDNGHHGDINGIYSFVPGISGKCCDFAATGYCDCGAFTIGSTFSVSIWAWVDSGSNSTRAIARTWATAGTNGWKIAQTASKQLQAGLSVGATEYLRTSAVLADGWHHVALTYNGSTMMVYIDGTPLEAYAVAGWTETTTEDIEISNGTDAGAYAHARIFSKVLTQAEVTFLKQYPAGSMPPSLVAVDPATDGLVGYYPLTGTVQDFSGYGYHGTLTPGTGGYEAGKSGDAYHLDGATSNVALPAFISALSAWTICAWVKLDTITPTEAYPRIVSLMNASNHEIGLYFHTANYKFYALLNNGTSYNTNANVAALANTWYFLVARYDGATLRIYVDGILQDDSESVASSSITPTLNSIGSLGSLGTSSNLDGFVQHVRLFNRAISQAEIDFLHNYPSGIMPPVPITADPGTDNLVAYYPLNGTAEDASPNSRHGEITFGQGLFENGHVGEGLHFDGAGTSVDLPNITTPSSIWSISCWINVDTWTDQTYILSHETSEGNFGLRTGGDIGYYDGTWRDFDVNLSTATWYHVVLVVQGTIATLYVNGTPKGSRSVTARTWSSGATKLGERFALGTNNFDGLMQHVRIFNDALTMEEIKFLYQYPAGSVPAVPTPVDPGSENLLCHWPCDESGDDEGTITVIRDVVGGQDLNSITESIGSVVGKVNGAIASVDAGGKAERTTALSSTVQAALATGNFSLAAWVYFGAELDYEPFVMFVFDTTKNVTILHDNDTASNPGVRVSLYNGATVQQAGITGANAAGILEYDRWHFVVFTVDRTNGILTAYIDGVYRSRTLAALHTFTTLQKIAFLGGSVADDAVDDVRLYSGVLLPENVMYLYRGPGGSPKHLIQGKDIGVASIDALAMKFAGYTSLITNPEVWGEGNGELFPLGFDLLSGIGRTTVHEDFCIEPAILVDSEENEYYNPRAKSWSGLAATPRTDTIGVWKATENLVPYPEDVTEWDATACVGSVLEETFEGVPWQRVICSGTAAASVEDLFEFSGDPAPVRVIVRKGPNQTGTANIYLYDASIAAGGVGYVRASIDFNAGTVTISASGTGITGTEVDEYWIVANEIVSLSFIAAGLSVGQADTKLQFYPDLIEANGRYADFCMIQVEDGAYPTPYTPSSRPEDGYIEYKKQLLDDGAIELWVRPRDNNAAAAHFIAGWYKDSSHYFVIYKYGTAAYARMCWGGTERYLSVASCLSITGWNHVKCAWNFSGNAGQLRIDGDDHTDTSWSAAPDTYDATGWRFFVGGLPPGATAIGAYTMLPFDGEITDMAIHNSYDYTDTHYDSNAPWRGPYDVPNYYQSLVLSRRFIKVTRGELAIVDKHHRRIHLGSQGIKALDRAGNVIHDIVNMPLLTNHIYGGHAYWYYGLSDYEILYDTSPAVSTWTEVPCLVNGNTNARIAILLVRMRVEASGGSSYISANCVFRPKGWPLDYDDPLPEISDQVQTTGSYMYNRWLQQFILCPIGEDNAIEYYYSRYPLSPTAEYLYIKQLGIFI